VEWVNGKEQLSAICIKVVVKGNVADGSTTSVHDKKQWVT